MNSITLSGNLTADAVSISGEGFSPFVSMTVANNIKWLDKNNEVQQKTVFVDCILSKNSVMPYALDKGKKGNYVTIIGYLAQKTRQIGDTKLNVHFLIINELHFG